MKASLLFYPNRAKKSKKNGKFPMYIRVLYKGKAESRLNSEISEIDLEKWNPGTMRFVGKNSINTALNKIQTNFEEYINNYATTLHKQNARLILDNTLGVNHDSDILALDYANNFFTNAIISNTEYENSTIKGYRKSINHFTKFLNARNTPCLNLELIDNSIAIEFKDYLLASNKEIGKIGMTQPSALSNIKKLRTIFDRAVSENLLSHNPFKLIKLRSQSPLREKLNIDQVKILYNLDLEGCHVQKIHRDIFLFSVFTGLAYCDAMAIKRSDLIFKENGDVKLSLIRKKTNILIEMILPAYALEIIERYKNFPDVNITNSILPNRSNQKYNVQLKVITAMAKIPVKTTTHIARHSFRQLIAEAGITDMGVIKRMMGHSSRRDIDGIYYSPTEIGLAEAKHKFEQYLNQNLL